MPRGSKLSPAVPLDDPDAFSFSGDLEDGRRPATAVRSEKSAPAPPSPPPLETGPASSPLLPPLPQLRALLSEHPEFLGVGLQPYTDEKGDSVPCPFPTAVGDIDLIARDADGALVVVTIVAPGAAGDNLVSEVLQRIGWVQRHLARGQRAVRGVVVLQTPLERLGYSATALTGKVQFKLCRMALYFDDVAP